MFLWKLRKKNKSLGEGLRSDSSILPRGSPCIGVHLEDPHPDRNWGRGLHWDRLCGRAVEGSDGCTESPPDGDNSEPQHPSKVHHRQRHGAASLESNILQHLTTMSEGVLYENFLDLN